MDKMTEQEVIRKSELKGCIVSTKEDLANIAMSMFYSGSSLPESIRLQCSLVSDLEDLLLYYS